VAGPALRVLALERSKSIVGMKDVGCSWRTLGKSGLADGEEESVPRLTDIFRNHNLDYCFRREIRKGVAMKMTEVFTPSGSVRIGSYGTGGL